MSYENLLVPLDCSRLAESVLPYALSLSSGFGLDIILYHACNPDNCHSVEIHRDYINRKAEVIKRKVSEARHDKSGPVLIKTVEVRGITEIGYPAEKIIRYSNENKISLVLVSRHGQSGIRQWVVGGTSDKILRASRVPVWLIQVPFLEENFDETGLIGKILVLLDGSEKAESILPYIQTLAGQHQVKSPELILLTVFDPAAGSTFENCKGAEEYLTGLGRYFKNTGLSVRNVVREGKPYSEIIAYAKSKLNINDLIAVTTHGESLPNGYGLSHIAEKIISEVSLPILVVRPD